MPVKKIPTKKAAAPKEKTAAKEKAVPQLKEKPVPAKYFEAVGRRKTSVARVRLYPAPKRAITINGKEGEKYFPTRELQKILHDPFERAPASQQFEVAVKVHGGGVHSQAEAVRHGITRAVLKYDSELRKVLKPWGFITRDPRMKERRKFGLKKARKAPQWAKR